MNYKISHLPTPSQKSPPPQQCLPDQNLTSRSRSLGHSVHFYIRYNLWLASRRSIPFLEVRSRCGFHISTIDRAGLFQQTKSRSTNHYVIQNLTICNNPFSREKKSFVEPHTRSGRDLQHGRRLWSGSWCVGLGATLPWRIRLLVPGHERTNVRWNRI